MLTPEVKMRGAIASAVSLACSDGNSDVKRVVDDVIACLAHAGFSIVPTARITEAGAQAIAGLN